MPSAYFSSLRNGDVRDVSSDWAGPACRPQETKPCSLGLQAVAGILKAMSPQQTAFTKLGLLEEKLLGGRCWLVSKFEPFSQNFQWL